MLILSRRAGEAINIGNDIVVTFLGTQGGQARIGVQSPENIKVWRTEIYDKIKGENT